MTERNPPVWLQTGTYSAEADRIVTGLLVDRVMTPAGELSKLQSGVVPPLSQLRTTVTGASGMSVTVSEGTAVVPRPSLNPPGAYLCHNDGPVSVVLSPVVSQARYDLIVARVLDQENGDAESKWLLEAVKGTESSTPSDPAVSGTAIKLARVLVRPASANGGVNRINASDITDARDFVSGLGGVHVAWDGRFPDHSVGRLSYVPSTKTLHVSDGLAWQVVLTTSTHGDYLKAYRPQNVYYSGQRYTKHSGGWSPNSFDAGTSNAALEPLRTPTFRTPSGQAKISMQCYGRGAAATVSGHMSFYIRNAANAVVTGGPGSSVYGWGPSFYGSSWSTGSMSSIISGLPVNADLHVLAVYRAESSGGVENRIDFSRIRIIVEPILGSP